MYIIKSILIFFCFILFPCLANTNNKPILKNSHQVKNKQTYTNSSLNFYIKDLTTEEKRINRNNYENIIYQKVCLYMEDLKKTEKKSKIDANHRKSFLKSVVKIYDKAFNLSDEHYLMYCIYNYYQSPAPREILTISSTLLSEKKQKQMQRMLKLCHQENKTGNGDSADTFTYSDQKYPAILFNMLSKEKYKQLSLSARLNYIQKIKKYYLQFELDIIKETSVLIGTHKNTPPFPYLIFPAGSLKRYISENKINLFLFTLLTPYAEAQTNWDNKCVIGGVTRKRSYSKKLKRSVCSVWGRSCDGDSNKFKCGDIFNNKCINIHPVKTISQRCYEASKDEPINTADYEHYKSSIEDVVKNYCVGDRSRYASCRFFNERVQSATQIQIGGAKEETITLLPRKRPERIETGLPEETKTEAQAPCTDCNKPAPQKGSVSEEMEQLRKTLPQETPSPLSDTELLNYFSDTIFKNSTCKCTGNDGCTRGCLPKEEVNPILSPPINRCRSKKPRERSQAKCARHVTGAVMSTIHKFLAIYCKENNTSEETNRDGYKQCVDDFVTLPNSEKNICKHSFIFPSALCFLGMDIENEDPYKDIPTRAVRNGCKKWGRDEHNKTLASFPVVQEDGSVKNIPLFKKLPVEQNALFQKDTSKIPEGSIVVATSGSIHGHVEIKTNKNECGPNKTACFCSDYCRDRKEYNSAFQVQAVFQWNPELISHIKENF